MAVRKSRFNAGLKTERAPLKALQLITVEYDVLIGFHLIPAENVFPGDRLFIVLSDQRLSDTTDWQWSGQFAIR